MDDPVGEGAGDGVDTDEVEGRVRGKWVGMLAQDAGCATIPTHLNYPSQAQSTFSSIILPSCRWWGGRLGPGRPRQGVDGGMGKEWREEARAQLQESAGLLSNRRSPCP